jgi:nucleoporin NUP82
MLAVYETIDLGLVSMLASNSSQELLQGNYPVCLPDPIHTDTIYVHHAFGVHALNLRSVLQNIITMLHNEDDSSLSSAVLTNTAVQPILSTFSVERK